MKSIVRVLAILVLSLAASAAWAQDKVVYHFDSGLEQATKGLRNISNLSKSIPRRRSSP